MTQQTASASASAVAALVRRCLPAIPFTEGESKTEADLQVAAGDLFRLVQGLKTHRDLAFDLLRNITAIDMMAEGLAAKYNLYSLKHRHSLQLTVLTAPGSPNIASITSLYATANWHEREAAEMVGLVFDGHPNLQNLLLEEDLRIHPLLKTHPLQKVEILQGIEDTKPGFDF